MMQAFANKNHSSLLLSAAYINFAIMQADVNMLREWFAGFNVRYFDGELPEPRFAVGRSRTRLGSMSWKVRRRLLFRSSCDYTIRVSNFYDVDERSFKNVLLHEMIHLYIVSKRIKDTAPHGVVFRDVMRRINADGWGISVSAKIGGTTGIVGGRRKRVRVVLAAVTVTGRHILSVVSPGYVKAVDSVLRHSEDVCSFSWHLSDDDYFLGFPAVRTPKGRRVTQAVYESKIAEMQPFEP